MNRNDSHPTGAEQPTDSVELAEYRIADEQLLARLDPEIQELARHIGDKIANLSYLADERDELERRVDQLEAQVHDLIKVAKVFASSDSEPGLGRRVAELEATMADVATAEHILRRVHAPAGLDEAESATPVVRAFNLGREIERRRWQALAEAEAEEQAEGSEPR